MMTNTYGALPYDPQRIASEQEYKQPESSTSNESNRSSEADERRAANRSSNGRSFGQRFVDILKSILGRNKKPVAYVRSGREVSFEKIPFYDTSGSRLSIDKTSEGKVLVKRKGRPGATSQRSVTSHLNRELVLSGNRRISTSVPEFRNRAHQHLRKTEEIRRQILNGEIETPGNREALLRKRLKEQARADGEVMDAAWLAEVRNHLGKSKGSDLSKLKAQITAMKNGDGKQAAENSEKKIELADPRMPRVKKFAPRQVDGESAEHVVKTKTVKEKAGETPAETLKRAIANGKKSQEAKADHNVVQRIEIKSEKDLPAPGQAESKSLEIIRNLKGKKSNGQSATDKNRPNQDAQRTKAAEAGEKKPEKAAVEPKAKQSVREMKQQGWRMHTPRNERPVANGDALSGAREMQDTATRTVKKVQNAVTPTVNKANAEGGSFRTAAEQSEASKTSDLAKAQAVQPATHTSKGSSSSGSNGQGQSTAQQGSAAQNTAANATMSQSKGIENLEQLLTKMESNARVLTSRGATTLRVTLRPRELGNIAVQIKEQDGKYNLKMRVENDTAARAVENHLPQIRDAMADRGIQLDNVDVRSNSSDNNNFTEQFEQRERARGSRSGRPTGASSSTSTDSAETMSRGQQSRSLNLGTNTMETVG
jgi:flagellar hook-length control protein FliK